MMKSVPVHEAVGMVLCHDMTRIVPGQSKGPAFRKGHVVTENDIAPLLEIGKEHVYVLTLDGGEVHENEAAERIARAAAGPGLTLTPVCEGRVNMRAEPGLLRVNVAALNEINAVQDVVLATLHTGQQITAPRDVAGTRVVPLVVDEAVVARVEALCAEHYPVIQVRPFAPLKVGMVTTGSEVYSGRIEDKFGPVVRRKFEALGSMVIGQRFCNDEVAMTRDAIWAFVSEGAQLVVATGGMSVDPDDRTPTAIRATGAEVVSYGAPTFPGAMFLLSYLGDVPVLGLPGCVMYHRASIFDLVVPRILAGERPTREDIIQMGHGGFCAGCGECRYPVCPFGK